MSENTIESKPMIWTGRVITGLVSLSLMLSASMKFIRPEGFEEGLAQLGWTPGVMTYIGFVEILCVVLYLIPRTAILGAILIAAYLGGATAAHVRIGDSFIVPVLLGMVAWIGLWLRDSRIRELLPVQHR
jgi:hypothetical protein